MRVFAAALFLALTVLALVTDAFSSPSPASREREVWEGEGSGASSTAGDQAAHPSIALGNLSDLLLDPHPGARLPLDTELADEQGSPVRLGRFFTGKPVVLAFEYLRCKTICGVALGRLAEAAAGQGATIVAISIDPRDTPADAAAAKSRYGEAGRVAGWHFLTGPQAAVRPLADAAGFHYRYDPASDQYLHSAGYVVVAANGTVGSYLPELDITPAELRAGIAAASDGQVSGPVERLLLLCFGGGLPAGRFTRLIESALILFNIAGVLAAIGLFARVRRRRDG